MHRCLCKILIILSLQNAAGPSLSLGFLCHYSTVCSYKLPHPLESIFDLFSIRLGLWCPRLVCTAQRSQQRSMEAVPKWYVQSLLEWALELDNQVFLLHINIFAYFKWWEIWQYTFIWNKFKLVCSSMINSNSMYSQMKK